jgi:nucleoside-diphosphate-sugar epimerase
VYGDCAGAWVAETRPWRRPRRALRRVNAERALRHLGRAGLRQHPAHARHLRARPRGRHARRGCARHAGAGAPDDVYTNHIHADDLARACVAALWRGGARAYNVATTAS